VPALAGEAWWGGQWILSCRDCAKVLGAPWRERVRPGVCEGCETWMEAQW